METVIQGVTYVSGVVYVSQEAFEYQSCKGCVGNCRASMSEEEKQEARVLCGALPHCSENGGIIFIRKLEAISTSEARSDGVKTDLIADPRYERGYDAGYSLGLAHGHTKGYDEAVAKYRVPVSITPSQAFARATDPSTSHQAAEAVARKAGKIADLILVELGSGGLRPPTYGLTGKQLAQRTGVPLNSITPRFAQLVRKGLIYAYSGTGRETVWALGNGVAA